MLAITALLATGLMTGAAAANVSTRASLRAQIDAIGARYLAAQAHARALDARLQTLDQRLAVSKRRTDRLMPIAKAHAVQLYQTGAQGFTVLFDSQSAMESARRAELISHADEHTLALLDEYQRSAAKLQLERAQVAAARGEQAKVVASLASEEHTLEGALAVAQARYRAAVAAKARADQSRTPTSRAPVSTPVIPVSSPPAGPSPTPPPPPPPGVNPHHQDPFLLCTRTRESDGDYGAVNPGGYYGAYQFAPTTWDLAASHAGLPQLIGVRPDAASPWDQDQVAWVLYQWQGKAPWGGLC